MEGPLEFKPICVQSGIKEKSLKPISDERLYKAVNVLLTYQNEDGGKSHHVLYFRLARSVYTKWAK